MSVLSSIFTDIAKAIRSKTGMVNTYSPSEMASAINSIFNGAADQYEYDKTATTTFTGVSTGNVVSYDTKILRKSYYYKQALGFNAVNLFNSNTSTFSDYPVIVFGDNIDNMYCTFFNCRNFNSKVIIFNAKDMTYTFYNCYNFNQPITIPNSVTSMAYTFGNCSNLNQSINIPSSVTNMYRTFYNCYNFNQPTTIPDSVTSMVYTFYNCQKFNQPIAIPNSVTNMTGTFYNCRNLGSNIKILREPSLTLDTKSMLSRSNNALIKNVYAKNLSWLNGTSPTNSITGTDITWTEMTNGYYNLAYNIYLYNNVMD